MDKMDLHVIRINKDKIITFIGGEDNVAALKVLLSGIKIGYGKMGIVVEYLVQNGVYCNVCCENDGICDSNVFTADNLNKLNECGLLVSDELAFEAMILKNRDKLNDSMSYIEDTIGKNEDEIERILRESEWLYKFEV